MTTEEVHGKETACGGGGGGATARARGERVLAADSSEEGEGSLYAGSFAVETREVVQR